MKRSSREKQILNKLLISFDKWEKGNYPGTQRGFQLAIQEIVTAFNIKHDEFPVMKRLIVDPNYTPPRSGPNLTAGTYIQYRWMQ